MQQQFVIYTRGRSGSAAIKSELGKHPDLICYGELFHPGGDVWNPNEMHDPREYFMPFAYFRANDYEGAEKLSSFQRLIRCAYPGKDPERRAYAAYLRAVVRHASQCQADAHMGFKLLSYQSRAHPQLLAEIGDKNLRIVHLIRRNRVRQVLSGMIATERGFAHRTKESELPVEQFSIDTAAFARHVEFIERELEHEKRRLSTLGNDYQEFYYECVIL